METTRKIPVLIVGGGPVGLALAVDLGWRGIPCMLVEQSDGRIVTPKMNEVNIRTMEFCRRWGIADDVHACPFPSDYPLDIAFLTSVAGHELCRVQRRTRMGQEPFPETPALLQVCSQMWFDPILQRFARSFPHVTLRYRTRLESFEQEGDSVTADIVDLESGRRERIEAEYLIGCDGANSQIRRALDIELTGETLGYPVHVFFRAPDLLKRFGRKPATFFLMVDREGMWSNLRIIDPVNAMWRLMVLESDGTLTPETVDRAGFLKRAIGQDIEVEWLGTSVWTRRSAVADSYGSGRVLLAGDAVHLLSPTGALGMNTGIGDAVDLGWKLAAVLNGWGGVHLLDSYGAERRPVGIRNVTKATEFFFAHDDFAEGFATIEEAGATGDETRRRMGEKLLATIGPMFRTLWLQIGYRYENSPICVDDGTDPIPDNAQHFAQSARPGFRAPHAWLADGRSTLDLYGRGFVLLRFGADAPDGSALETAAAEAGLPLKTVTITDKAAMELYERRLVLVRPDGHVAWRADEVPVDADAVIDRVRGASASSAISARPVPFRPPDFAHRH